MNNDGVTLRARESRFARIAMAVAVLAAILVVTPAAQGVVHGVTVTPGDILGAENPSDSGDYTVVLTQIPSGDVEITVTPDSQVTVDNSTLTFTTLDWNIAQTVVVTPIDDAVVEGSHVGIVTHSASGGGYDAVSIPDYTITITDDDTAGVTITPTTVSATEGGATGSYTVELDSVPAANVTVTVAGDAQATGSALVAFTPATWNVQQTVTVTATNDNVVEGAHGATITNTVTSTDPDYNFSANSVTVNITDNDSAGVTITPTTVSATEGGASGSYTVELDSVPAANVTVAVGGDAQATGSALVAFTPGTWNVQQTVTVTAINDNVVEGAHGATITNTVTSADPDYNFSANSVNVNITDNDFSVAFVASSSAVFEGSAGSSPATVAVVLNTNGRVLTAAASVNVVRTGGTATPGGDFSFASPATVTFPIGASNGTQRSVTVTVNGDTGNEPDETVILGLSAPSTGGSIVSPVAHTLTISNDDVEPGLSVLNAAPVLEGPAAELSFTVILEPASGQIVTVNYATANGTAEAPSDYVADAKPLTFQPGETIKEVLVAVAQDGVDEIAETVFLNLTGAVNTTLADDQGVGTILDVDNVAPLVGPLTTADLVGNPGFEFAPGQTVKLSGAFTDPGLADTHTVLVDWGDGTASTLIPITPIGSRTFEATHVYADAGFFQITVRADDADGGSSGERLAFVTVSGSAVGGGDDTVGLVDITRGVWRLYDGAGVMATEFFFGNPGDIPFMGDWDGDGIDTPGLYRQSDGFVYLRNLNSQGIADIRFFFGNPGDVPIAGDFNNDGKDTVSIYRPSNQTFYIINKLGANDGGLGPADFSYVFGDPGDNPYTGDFDGDGWDTVGLHRESTGLVYFLNLHQQGNAAQQFIFGDPGDQIISGDWTGDGIDTPALYRSSDQTFYFRFTNTQGPASASFFTGLSGWVPVSGNTGL